MKEEEDDDCGNLLMHPLTLLQDPTSGGGGPSSPWLQTIFIPCTCPTASRLQQPHEQPSCLFQLRTDGGKHSSSILKAARSKAFCCHHNPGRPGAASCQLGGGDNYQCPQRVTRGTGRTRDLPLPEGSDMAGGGPCVSGVIPGGCRRSGGLCPRQATQGTNPGPGLCPPKRHTHTPNLVPGAGRACLPLRRAGPDPPVPGPRTRPVPPQEPGLSLVSPPRPPPVTETGPGVPHNRSEPTGTSGNAAFIPAPQTETRPSL